jgi:rhodanese-related sulfurtransferase
MALKAMTSETTGAIVAAPTTSLPEDLGGVRNWDYRYCWLRDSVLALEALLVGGYTDETLGFRDFMARAGTGDPAKIKIMYAIGGERRLTEFELDKLPGYGDSKPVRVGNAASEQFQLDVYGEVIGVAYRATELVGRVDERLWPRWRTIIDYVESIWREPDDGIWESRGPRRHYTYSKVVAWLVFDRGVRLADRFGLDAPVERWRQARDEIHREVCERGYDAGRRVHPVLRLARARRERAQHPAGRVPARHRRTRHVDDRRDLARARPRRLRRALLDRRDRRRPARRGGPVPRVLVLARQRAGPQGPRRRGARPVRPAARPDQRPRPAGRGVRRRAGAPGRQLPAGVQPPDPHDVDLRLGTSAKAVREEDGRLVLELDDGTSLDADVLVMAAGARPNAGLARDAGLEIGPRGGIAVDEHMRTSNPDIPAAGDAVETPHLLTGAPVLSMLAGPANREGRIAADTIPGRDSAYRGTQGTAVVKVFDMPAGGTGMTETELRAAGMDYRKVYDHHNGHAAYYPGTSPLFIKCLFAPADGRLLGAQVLGWDGVDKRIDVFAVALRAGMTVFDLEHLELAYAPPYGSAKDPVNMVGFLGANLLRGDIDLWYPEDYPECAGRVTILDTRTQAEYDAWHILEAILMPYTDLRAGLDELPRDKPVYTYCRSGFRSYIAYCALKQSGFDDVAFLAGGMMTFHGFHRTPLEVGKGGMPVVAHAGNEIAGRAGALEHV